MQADRKAITAFMILIILTGIFGFMTGFLAGEGQGYETCVLNLVKGKK